MNKNESVGPVDGTKERWIQALSHEDLSFIKRFVLASGSLKALAAEYGISYPTVRLRLDRLIERIRIHDDAEIQSEFERTLRTLIADGQIDLAVMRKLLHAHRQEIQAHKENTP